MFDYITVACFVGLLALGVLWKKASAKVWYMDSDNAPVSLKAIVGFLWMICLVTLIYQQLSYINR
jgi:hypothetical protein